MQYITEKLDAGEIILSKEIKILDTDNGETLLEKLTELGIKEITGLLERFEHKKFDSTPQDHSIATHCKKILPEDRLIDFRNETIDIFNKVRAFYPYHITYCQFRNKRLNICEAGLWNGKIHDLKGSGTLYLVDKKTLVVECGDGGLLELITVQPENKNKMKISEFINGYRPISGETLN